MENLLHFLGDRAVAWSAMILKPSMLASVAFLILLLVIDIHRRGWKLSWSRRAVEGALATIAIFHVNFLLLPLVWLSLALVQDGYDALGIPHIPADAWSGFPTWALVVIAILAHDFANYWNHRFMHLPWIWPIHAIHHSDTDVNGLTGYRVHALEGLVMWSSYVLLLTWLGLPSDAIGIGAVFVALHVIYVHIDADWGHGPFALLIASPRFHRWHHADVEELYGKNLANIFPFFDWMFGTYHVPGACRGPLGARGVPQNDVIRLMLWPFLEWLRMAQSGLRSLAGRKADGADQAIPTAARQPVAGTALARNTVLDIEPAKR